MYGDILNREIERFSLDGKKINLEFGKFNLLSNSDSPIVNNVYDLSSGVLIVKNINFIIKTSNFDISKSFILLKSFSNNIIVKDTISISKNDDIYIVKSTFPSCHFARLIIKYDMNDFFVVNKNEIIGASLEYAKVNNIENE